MEIKENQCPNFEIDKRFFVNEMLTSVGRKHLDYGCGNGLLTNEMYNSLINFRDMTGMNQITGYDIDKNIIQEAKDQQYNKNISFTSSKEELEKLAPFNSATLFFSYHHLNNPSDDFKTIHNLLKPNSTITIVDFNLGHINNISDFKKIFSSPSEKRELQSLGDSEAFKIHTQTDLKSCIKDLQNSGFKTARYKELNPDKKYFLWVGYKD